MRSDINARGKARHDNEPKLPNASDAYHTGGVWIGLPTAKKHQRRIESEVLGKGKVWVAMCHP
jgi:hypothetical protein|tara:strand:+ start:543 stop:731 length:189 start_codon:yes stop_codon:yes gene_type:complete